MKFYLALIFLIPTCLFSQNADKVFTLKPSLGLNGCQIHGDGYSGYNKLGMFAGLGVNAKLNLRSSIELGFYFSQKGARHNQNPKAGDYSFYRLNLNYIDMPLSYCFYVSQNYYLTGGASFAYLFSYSEIVNNTNLSAYSHFNKTEVGINIGLGKKLKNGFSAELRCSNSVKTVRNYGIAATLVYYNNPIARFFNKGFYNNLLTLFFSYQIGYKRNGGN
jgi:hypothetical protein